MINDFCQIGWSDPFPQPQRDNQENFQDPRPTPDEIYNYIEEVKQTNKEKMQKSAYFRTNKIDIEKLKFYRALPEGSKKKYKKPSKAKTPAKVDLTYTIDRYVEENSPVCVYIPSKLMMFKMMKACIGCHQPEDLWIHQIK